MPTRTSMPFTWHLAEAEQLMISDSSFETPLMKLLNITRSFLLPFRNNQVAFRRKRSKYMCRSLGVCSQLLRVRIAIAVAFLVVAIILGDSSPSVKASNRFVQRRHEARVVTPAGEDRWSYVETLSRQMVDEELFDDIGSRSAHDTVSVPVAVKDAVVATRHHVKVQVSLERRELVM